MEYSTIFFRLFNLFILVAAFIYLFKTKFLGIIQNSIKDKLQYLKSFQQKRQEVIQQRENLDITIAQEHALMERLRSNVLQWNTLWQQQEDAHKKSQKQIELKIQALLRRQRQNRSNQIIQEKVVPMALNNAHKELDRKFAQPKQQEKYLNALFDVIAK